MVLKDLLNEVKEELKEVPKHPIVDDDMDVKFSYLSGITMMANCTGKINAEKKKKIKWYMKSMNIPFDMKEKLLSIGKSPTKEQLKQLILLINENNLAKTFLTDLAVISYIDGKMDKDEEENFNIFSELLKIASKDKKMILDFAKLLYTEQNESKDKLNKEHMIFPKDSIFDYHLEEHPELEIFKSLNKNEFEGKITLQKYYHKKYVGTFINIVLNEGNIVNDQCISIFNGGKFTYVGQVYNIKNKDNEIIKKAHANLKSLNFEIKLKKANENLKLKKGDKLVLHQCL